MTQANEPWTVRKLLEWTSGFFTRKEVDSPRLSAELLLSHVLGVPRIKLYTDYERNVDPQALGTFRELVKRAGEQEPIAYLTGRAYFFNLEFEVTRETLIPRPETETLVEHVLQTVRNTTGLEAPRVLDLCTGTGCVAAAVAQRLKQATVVATDLSPGAAAVARRNLEKHGLGERVRVLEGDLFDALKDEVDAHPFDLILANPPYIPSGKIAELDKNVRDYEPRLALDGGADGLALVRRILAEAPERLTPGGRTYIEIQFDQGPAALELAREVGAFEEAKVLKDFSGHDRVVMARKKAG